MGVVLESGMATVWVTLISHFRSQSDLMCISFFFFFGYTFLTNSFFSAYLLSKFVYIPLFQKSCDGL